MTDRERSLMRVQTTGFALNEAVLFLDTHRTDKDALEYYQNARDNYNNAVRIYVENYGAIDNTQVKDAEKWIWNDGCMPWEADCNVEI